MAQHNLFCPDCGQIFSERVSKCGHCGRRFQKSLAEAYTSPTGLGLFDLIPGIRDLPDRVRYMLMLVVLTCILSGLILVPTLLKFYHHVAAH